MTTPSSSAPPSAPPKPYAWICEFCFRTITDAVLPDDWKLIWQSAVCPECDRGVQEKGGYNVVPGGAFANGKKDPRAPPSADAPGTPDVLTAELSYFGCFTGDCPHETQAECNAAIRQYATELEADVSSLRAQLATLQERCNEGYLAHAASFGALANIALMLPGGWGDLDDYNEVTRGVERLLASHETLRAQLAARDTPTAVAVELNVLDSICYAIREPFTLNDFQQHRDMLNAKLHHLKMVAAKQRAASSSPSEGRET